MPKESSLTRPSVSALDEILGEPFKVLDDGFVRVIDYLGNDAAVVQAARVSFGVGTKAIHEDRGLIRYLLRHSHSTPFEMCEVKLHVRVPMDTWRQWIRHRTANVNEYSTRYSIAIDSAQRTPPAQWRHQSTRNKQGSSGKVPVEIGESLSRDEAILLEQARAAYERRLALGVAREQARKDLPLSTYTEAYWKIDLYNLLHFLQLRLDPLAQYEIREYANIIAEKIVAPWVPVTWEAFVDYRHRGIQLSEFAQTLVAALVSGDSQRAHIVASKHGFIDEKGIPTAGTKQERAELADTLQKLGLRPPWTE